MQLRRYCYWCPLVVGIIAGGLGVGGAFYAATGAAGPAPVAVLSGIAASASQEDAPPVLPRDPAGPVLDASPDSGGPVLEGPVEPPARQAAPVAKAGAAPPPAARRLIGEVTAISADPAAFTVRTQQGDETTYRVFDTTVFKAGYDRPYNFGLLKAGDGVNVLARLEGAGPAGAGRPKPALAGGAASKRPRQPDSVEPDPGLVAAQVAVRPAGEAPYRGGNAAAKPGAAKPGAAKPGAAKKGAS